MGEALVHELSAGGWRVLAVVKQASHAEALQGLVGVDSVVYDVRSDDVRAVLDAVKDQPVDVLINNAARGAPHQPLGSVQVDAVLNSVDVNVAGPLRMVQALLPSLLGSTDPVIINISSRLGSASAQARGDFTHLSTSYAYRISKAAQNMLTISLAHDLRGKVRCWAVHPGKLATDLGQADAVKHPREAAQQLRLLLETADGRSPRFVSLGETDLDW
ncbi:SDR family NAD(P)-dependent oxidoreductase [Arthrobacter sp. D1-29]